MTENKRTAVLIDVLYAVAIGINLWLLMDQMTGGELNREAANMARGLAEKVRKERAERRQLRHDRWEMFMQAHDIVKEGSTDDR